MGSADPRGSNSLSSRLRLGEREEAGGAGGVWPLPQQSPALPLRQSLHQRGGGQTCCYHTYTERDSDTGTCGTEGQGEAGKRTTFPPSNSLLQRDQLFRRT